MTAHDVIVAGAGPVGLTLALGLADRGLGVLVLEAEPTVSADARASTWHPSSLELLDQWGVAEAIIARGAQVDRLQFWERSTRTCVAELPYALIAGDTRFPFRLQCPQHEVTPILLEAARARGAAIRFGHRVVDATEHGDEVAVEVETAGGRHTERARFLCAADGARSTVRQRLGLSFTGATNEDRFLLCALAPDDLALERVFPGIGPVAYVFDPDEWVIVMSLRDRVRVVFRLAADADVATALTDDALAARLARLLGRPAPPVLARSSYAVHQRVAERFRVGRVVLLGDAAHVNNPAGGLGMNSGIHDAAGLVGPLAARLDQAVDGDLRLDAWATRRRRAAVEGVQRDAARNYQSLVARDAGERAARDRELAAIAADPAAARRFLLQTSLLEARA